VCSAHGTVLLTGRFRRDLRSVRVATTSIKHARKSLLLGQRFRLIPILCRLQPEHDRRHRFRELPAAAIFLQPCGPYLRLFRHQYPGVQLGFHALFETLNSNRLPVLRRSMASAPARSFPRSCTNTVNNPINPTQGKYLYAGLTVEGLGGNVRTISPVMEAKYFRPRLSWPERDCAALPVVVCHRLWRPCAAALHPHVSRWGAGHAGFRCTLGGAAHVRARGYIHHVHLSGSYATGRERQPHEPVVSAFPCWLIKSLSPEAIPRAC